MNRFFFKLTATIYRMIQRMIVLDISKLVVRDIGVEPEKGGTSLDATFRFISMDEVLLGAEDPELDLQPEMADRLNSGLDKCAGAIVDGKLVGYLWVALKGIEAEHNSGKHPNSGIAVSFEADSAFVYKGYSKRAYRKQGLSCLLTWTANQLAESHGIRKLISTTEWLNVPAYRALTGSGFNFVGNTWRMILFGVPTVWGPREAAEHGIRLGKDAVVPERKSIAVAALQPDTCELSDAREEPVGV